MNIDTIFTETRPTIMKIIQEKYTEIRHYCDSWLVSKDLKKQVCSLGKNPAYKKIMAWQTAMTNHLHWIASSSSVPGTNFDKWVSFLNHVCNIHQHDGTFPSCLHGPVEFEKMWVEKDSELYHELKKIVYNKRLLSAIEKLSPLRQTYSTETFQKVIRIFTPKGVHFDQDFMMARLTLAILHFNENYQNDEIELGSNEMQHNMRRNHQRANQSTYGYVEQLFQLTFRYLKTHETIFETAQSPTAIRPLALKYSYRVREVPVLILPKKT